MQASRYGRSIVRTNGQNAIGINIQKQSDANAVEVSRLVKEELENDLEFFVFPISIVLFEFKLPKFKEFCEVCKLRLSVYNCI